MKKLKILIFICFCVAAVMYGTMRIRIKSAQDLVPPVVTVDSDTIELSVQAEDADYLSGVTAADNRDGDVTDSLVVAEKSNFISPGRFKVTYAAFDSHNNVGYATRTVNFTDYTPPRFSMTRPFRYLTSDSYSLLDGMSAEDAVDGDVTNGIRYSYGKSTDATHADITYEVTNSFGDTSQLTVPCRIYSDFAEYAKDTPQLTDYIVYTTPGQAVDVLSLVDGIWRNGKTVLFDDQNGEGYTLADIRVDDTAVDYNTPGVYTITVGLAADPETGDTASSGNPVVTVDTTDTTDLYVVVEEETNGGSQSEQ